MSDGTPNPATWPMWRGPAAYGHATATRIFWGGTTEHDTSGLVHDRKRRGVSAPPNGHRDPAEHGKSHGGLHRDDRRPVTALGLRPRRRALMHAPTKRRLRSDGCRAFATGGTPGGA
jgi:hypothetical protein